MADISSSSDTIDVRDIIARVEELEDERDTFTIDEDANLAPDGPGYANDAEAWAAENGGDAEELKKLTDLLEELAGNGGDGQWRGDWYPIELINDDHFVDAMRELVSDIGGMPKEIPAYLEIDWEKTADNLRADYSSVEYEGETFWYR